MTRRRFIKKLIGQPQKFTTRRISRDEAVMIAEWVRKQGLSYKNTKVFIDERFHYLGDYVTKGYSFRVENPELSKRHVYGECGCYSNNFEFKYIGYKPIQFSGTNGMIHLDLFDKYY